MSQLFYLSAEQLERIKPFFPRSHGIPRVDDRKVISGIIYVIKHGLQWKDAPREYGPYKTLYNRFLRWSQMAPGHEAHGRPGKRLQRSRPAYGCHRCFA